MSTMKHLIDLIPRRAGPAVPLHDWKPITAIFAQEKPMPTSYYGHFEIREINELGTVRPDIRLEVYGITALPSALKRLVEMGHDLRPALQALQAACAEQDKQRTLQAAIDAIAKPAE